MEDSPLTSRTAKIVGAGAGGADPVLKRPPSNFVATTIDHADTSVSARAVKLWHSIREGQQLLVLWGSTVTLLLFVAVLSMLLTSGRGGGGAPGSSHVVAMAAKLDVAHDAVLQLAKKIDAKENDHHRKHSKKHRAAKRLRKQRDMRNAVDTVLGARLDESIAKHIDRVLERVGAQESAPVEFASMKTRRQRSSDAVETTERGALKCWTPSGEYNPQCCNARHSACDECTCGRLECCRGDEGSDPSAVHDDDDAATEAFRAHFAARREAKLIDAAKKAKVWAKDKIQSHAVSLASSIEDVPFHQVGSITGVLDQHIASLAGTLHEIKTELVALLADKVRHATPHVHPPTRMHVRCYSRYSRPPAPPRAQRHDAVVRYV
jgi:hypothetical protein